MVKWALFSLVVLLSGCGTYAGHDSITAGRFPQSRPPAPDECTNLDVDVANQPDGSYTDANGCETLVINHQVVSNKQG